METAMLRRLRLKFVALNMATAAVVLAVVLAVVFTAICGINYQQGTNGVRSALDVAIDHAGDAAKMPPVDGILAPTRPAPAPREATAWGLPSRAKSPKSMGGASPPPATRPTAPPSPSRCPFGLPEPVSLRACFPPSLQSSHIRYFLQFQTRPSTCMNKRFRR